MIVSEWVPRTAPRTSIRVRREQPVLTKRPRMTVGIGMLCEGGAIIAADTRTVYSDGATSQMRKIRTATSQDAVYITAFSSEDVPATETLLSDIFHDLQHLNITALTECEDVVRAQMARWVAAHPNGAPTTEFLFAAALLNEHALYHCQPPNSMNRKSYFAIGQGAAITDPIRKIFFRNERGPRRTLWRIAYMMFRAKTDYGSACGGLTNAAFLKWQPPTLFEISSLSMSLAEQAGASIDMALEETMDSVLSGTIPIPREQVESAIESCQFRGFVTNNRQVIEEDGSVRQLPPRDLTQSE